MWRGGGQQSSKRSKNEVSIAVSMLMCLNFLVEVVVAAQGE